jgi:predicted dehydrogenase
MRVVLVGAGNACRLWLRPALESADAEVVCLVDQVPERATALLAEHGAMLPVAADLATALEQHRPQLVVDLTPPEGREHIAAIAFDAGCDLIVEKPLATAPGAARAVLERADAAGRRLAVMQNHRFHPGARALRRLAASGDLGELVLLSGELHRAVEGFDRLAGHPSPLLADMAIHDFDQARHLTGGEPRGVLAVQETVPGSGFAGATVVTCVFRFGGGLLFRYTGSWSAAGNETPWFGAWRLDGRAASATWDGAGTVVVERLTGFGPGGPMFEREQVRLPDEPNDHPAAVPELLRQMVSGEPLETDAHDNVRSLAMVDAAMASARDGSWIDLTE